MKFNSFVGDGPQEINLMKLGINKAQTTADDAASVAASASSAAASAASVAATAVQGITLNGTPQTKDEQNVVNLTVSGGSLDIVDLNTESIYDDSQIDENSYSDLYDVLAADKWLFGLKINAEGYEDSGGDRNLVFRKVAIGRWIADFDQATQTGDFALHKYMIYSYAEHFLWKTLA